MDEDQVIQYYQLDQLTHRRDHALDIIFLLTCPQAARETIIAQIEKEENDNE
jgi:hypothetical protein